MNLATNIETVKGLINPVKPKTMKIGTAITCDDQIADLLRNNIGEKVLLYIVNTLKDLTRESPWCGTHRRETLVIVKPC